MKKLLDYRKEIASGQYDQWLRDLYGSDSQTVSNQRNRIIGILNDAAEQFSTEYQNLDPWNAEGILMSSPGRTELLGNHTDHNGGRVLTSAIDMDSISVVLPRSDGKMRLVSREFGKSWEIDIRDSLTPRSDEYEDTSALLRGCAGVLLESGNIGGFSCYISSRIPSGSGISSSASLEVLLLSIQNILYNNGRIPMTELARLAGQMENLYFGKGSGLMDQMSCGHGGVLKIDFLNPQNPVFEQLSFHPEDLGYRFFLIDTRGSHAGLSSAYDSMPNEMKAVAAALGHKVLGTADEEVFLHTLPKLRNELTGRALNRALHFFSENHRVDAASEAVEENDIAAYLNLMNQSGESSALLLQNVLREGDLDSQELALALGLSKNILGPKGACRVHGGGLAGTIQALVSQEKTAEWIGTMENVFGQGSVLPITLRDAGVSIFP